jgi:hypothetical protein
VSTVGAMRNLQMSQRYKGRSSTLSRYPRSQPI